MKLVELVLVLAAIIAPSMLASWQGDNYGKHDLERTAKGAVTAAVILKVYSLYKEVKSD